MFIGTDLYAGVLLLTVLPTAYLLSLVWHHRDQPGGRWFVLGLLAGVGWSVFWGLMLLFDGYALSVVSFNLVVTSVTVAFLSMLFVAIEYTWRTRIGPRVVVPFLVVPVVAQLLLWTNPLHGLFWGPGTYVDARGILYPDHGLAFLLLHAGYGYLLVVASVVLFTVALVNRGGVYRKQAALMLLGWLVPATASALFVFDVVPTDYLNPTPIASIAGIGIWGVALFRYRLLKTVPVARRTALRVLGEGIVMVDERGLVTDTNPAARSLLDIDGDPTGESLKTVLADFPSLSAVLLGDAVADETVTLPGEDGERFVTVSKTPVRENGSAGGWVIALDDRTAEMRYEADLELLKGVLARVLRHDIRNQLNVVRMNGELLANRTDGSRADWAQSVVDAADDIIDTAETARAVESLVDTDRDRYDIDAARVARETVEWAAERFPDAVIELDVPDEAWVRADEALDIAVQNLVENAIVHNESPSPRVSVAVDVAPETVRIVVADDGPGISNETKQVLDGRSVDQLNHGSGLGLWLVNWAVRNSDGTVTIETTETGTRVTVELPRRFGASPDATASGHSNPQA